MTMAVVVIGQNSIHDEVSTAGWKDKVEPFFVELAPLLPKKPLTHWAGIGNDACTCIRDMYNFWLPPVDGGVWRLITQLQSYDDLRAMSVKSLPLEDNTYFGPGL